MVSQSKLDFHRQCVVVADDVSPAAAFLIDTLRLDGHRVTHLSEARAVAFDLALDDCHLFICGSGIGGMRAVNLIADLRANAPDLPILCVAAALRWTRRLEGMLPADVTMLREPLTGERLRAAVRPLLPLPSGGTTLAWPDVVQDLWCRKWWTAPRPRERPGTRRRHSRSRRRSSASPSRRNSSP